MPISAAVLGVSRKSVRGQNRPQRLHQNSEILVLALILFSKMALKSLIQGNKKREYRLRPT